MLAPKGGWEFHRGGCPVVVAAIHAGHELCPGTEGLLGVSEQLRLREEDPYTSALAQLAPNHILVRASRFNVDLNRPRAAALYRTPEEAWGLPVWQAEPPEAVVQAALHLYDEFYRQLHAYLRDLCSRFETVAVLDLHSFCWRRRRRPGEGTLPDFDLGTRTLDRHRWGWIVERLRRDLQGLRHGERRFQVTENQVFGGGYFPAWINERFQGQVACIGVEVRKFFMDEETGQLFPEQFTRLEEAIQGAIAGISEEIHGSACGSRFHPPVAAALTTSGQTTGG